MEKYKMIIVLLACIFALGFVSYANAGLVARWTFNEFGGDTVFDSTENFNDGTVIGDPRLRGTIFLDGNDHVEIPDSASLAIGSAYTVEAWVKNLTTTSGSEPIIVGRTGAAAERMTIYAGFVYWYIQGGGSGIATQLGSGWNHIVGVASAAGSKLYRNGVLMNSQTFYGIQGDTSDISIGKRSGDFLIGLIDEISIYNNELTAAEVAANFAAGPVGEGGTQGPKGDKGDKGDPGEITLEELDDAIEGHAHDKGSGSRATGLGFYVP